MIQFVWAAIPIAIGLSMHRHRLYDIDRLISRTVSYALVVGTLLIAYSGMVFAVGALPLEGSIEVAAATLAVAALFNPVRKRIQTVVDRKFNRSRYDAEVVVEDFANGLRNETDGDRILRGWMGVVSETMEPSSVGVWTR
jgi:small-conductance mechanosensitive channel